MLSATLAISVSAAAGLAVGETHPFTVDDLLAMQRVSDPQVSPDGRWVAFTLATVDLEANRSRSDVWLAPVDPAADPAGARRLTTDPASDWNARWMPDGSALVFLSTRGGSAQVWRLPLAGGEAQQLTELPVEVGNLAVFPGGERLLLTLEVYPDATPAETAERDSARASEKSRAQAFESLLFRHWDQYEDGKRSHVFVVPLAGGANGGSGEPIDLMRGLDADCPTKPFGGGEEIAIAPDGKEVVFAARAPGADAAWTTDIDLWSVPADGSVEPSCLTAENEAWDTAPAFSPDGRTLCYAAMARPGFEADRFRLVLLDLASGKRRVLTEDFDRSVAGARWSADGQRLLAASKA